jgi:hypothetical protein
MNAVRVTVLLGILPAALAATLFAKAPVPAEKEKAPALKFLAHDAVDGKASLNWKALRPDPTHAAVGKRPNRLTITTQAGSINRDERQRGTSCPATST